MKKLLLFAAFAIGMTANAQVASKTISPAILKSNKGRVTQPTQLKTLECANYVTPKMKRGGRAILGANNNAMQLHNDTYLPKLSVYPSAPVMEQQLTVAQYIPSYIAEKFVGDTIVGGGGYMPMTFEGDYTFFVCSDPTNVASTSMISKAFDYDDILSLLDEGDYDPDMRYMFFAPYYGAENELVITPEMAKNGFYVGYTGFPSSDPARYIYGTQTDMYVGMHPLLTTGNYTKFTNAFLIITGQGENADVEDFSDPDIYYFDENTKIGSPEYYLVVSPALDENGNRISEGYKNFDVKMPNDFGVIRSIEEDVVTLRPTIRNIGRNDWTSAEVTVTYKGEDGSEKKDKAVVEFSTPIIYGQTAALNLDRILPGCGRLGYSVEVNALSGPTSYKYTPGTQDAAGYWTASDVKTQNITNKYANGTAILMNSDYAADRKFVMESFMGAWDGYTPRAMVAMDKLVTDYDDLVIPIGVHLQAPELNDPYGCGPYGNGYYRLLSQYIIDYGTVPYAFFNRSVGEGDPFFGSSYADEYAVTSDVDAITDSQCEAAISVGSVKNDEVITATATMTFAIPAEGSKYGVAFVITEDELPITQKNYFGYSQYKYKTPEMAEWQNTMPVDAETTTNFVARYISDEYAMASKLADNPSIGKHLTFSLDINTADFDCADLEKCSIIALLIDQENLQIVNAAKAKLGEEDPLEGIKSVNNKFNGSISAQAGQINLNGEGSAKVYNTAGQLVYDKALNGNATVSLPNGSYIVRIANGKDVFVKKVAL